MLRHTVYFKTKRTAAIYLKCMIIRIICEFQHANYQLFFGKFVAEKYGLKKMHCHFFFYKNTKIHNFGIAILAEGKYLPPSIMCSKL
jgi:hypothetical protein